MKPGEYIFDDSDITCNVNKKVIKLSVTNSGDRPIQVGSHFHFYEVNAQLIFDRDQAYGKRLNILSGSAIRFEPGDEKIVSLINIGGNRAVYGLNEKVNNKLTKKVKRG